MDDMFEQFEKLRDETEGRNQSLEQTLGVAEKFWDDTNNTMDTLKDLEESIVTMEPPALEVKAIRDQRIELEVFLLLVNLHCIIVKA